MALAEARNSSRRVCSADAIGNELDGDEIAALELREDLISHLRYLDMAVYNNVFNPIGEYYVRMVQSHPGPFTPSQYSKNC